jgi:hypothetical protein
MLSWQTGSWGCAAPILFPSSPCRVGRAPWFCSFVAARVVMVVEGVGWSMAWFQSWFRKPGLAAALFVVRVGFGGGSGSRAGVRGLGSERRAQLLAEVRGKAGWMVQWRVGDR